MIPARLAQRLLFWMLLAWSATAKPAAAVLAPRLNPPEQGIARRIFFRYDGTDDNFGRLAVTSNERPQQMQFAGDLHCEVVYVRSGRGICMTVEQRLLGLYSALIFDPVTFKVITKIPTAGLPSRARMSTDGRLAAYTVFTTGHGYAEINFATRTSIVNTSRAGPIIDLESFSISKDGQPFKNQDFNFWGVSFAPDANRFYATLSTGGQRYLVQGQAADRTAKLIQSNVECPSVSPDGRRIAYKKRVGTSRIPVWEFHSMDLESGQDHALSEHRSVDDQLEWLDDNNLLYTVPTSAIGPVTDVWIAPADGSGTPRKFLLQASSPSVLR